MLNPSRKRTIFPGLWATTQGCTTSGLLTQGHREWFILYLTLPRVRYVHNLLYNLNERYRTDSRWIDLCAKTNSPLRRSKIDRYQERDTRRRKTMQIRDTQKYCRGSKPWQATALVLFSRYGALRFEFGMLHRSKMDTNNAKEDTLFHL